MEPSANEIADREYREYWREQREKAKAAELEEIRERISHLEMAVDHLILAAEMALAHLRTRRGDGDMIVKKRLWKAIKKAKGEVDDDEG